jgi:hypothetical protein
VRPIELFGERGRMLVAMAGSVLGVLLSEEEPSDDPDCGGDAEHDDDR